MPNVKNLFLAVPLAFVLSGCVVAIGGHDRDDIHIDWQDRQESNRRAISELEPGMSKDAVLSRLGDADFSESLNVGDDRYIVLYYRTHRTHEDGDTTKDETTPVIFKNNQLEGWGETLLYKLNHS